MLDGVGEEGKGNGKEMIKTVGEQVMRSDGGAIQDDDERIRTMVSK